MKHYRSIAPITAPIDFSWPSTLPSFHKKKKKTRNWAKYQAKTENWKISMDPVTAKSMWENQYLQLFLSMYRGCHIGVLVLINLSKKSNIKSKLLHCQDWERDVCYNSIITNSQYYKSYLDDLATTLVEQKKTTKVSLIIEP